MVQEGRAFGSRLLAQEQGLAKETGQALLDLATDFYSPVDTSRKDMGVRLRGLGERLVGLDEQVLHPLAERLESLGKGPRSTEESRAAGTEIRLLARDLLELGDGLGALALEGGSMGSTVRPLVERTLTLSRRLKDLGTRVGAVGDRVLAMRPEELQFLSSMVPAHRVGGAPVRTGSSMASAAAPR